MTRWIRASIAVSLLTWLLFGLVLCNDESRQPLPTLWQLRAALLTGSLLSSLVGIPVVALAERRGRSREALLVAALAGVASLPMVGFVWGLVFPGD
jgi:hypothetical protein